MHAKTISNHIFEGILHFVFKYYLFVWLNQRGCEFFPVRRWKIFRVPLMKQLFLISAIYTGKYFVYRPAVIRTTVWKYLIYSYLHNLHLISLTLIYLGKQSVKLWKCETQSPPVSLLGALLWNFPSNSEKLQSMAEKHYATTFRSKYLNWKNFPSWVRKFLRIKRVPLISKYK